MKAFNQEALTRILVTVDRVVAIGAITKSELFKKSELEKTVDDLIELLPVPGFVWIFLEDMVPGFFQNVKDFIILICWKWITLSPGEQIEIDIPEFEVEEPPEGKDYKTLYEEMKKNYENAKKEVDRWKKIRSNYKSQYQRAYQRLYRRINQIEMTPETSDFYAQLRLVKAFIRDQFSRI